MTNLIVICTYFITKYLSKLLNLLLRHTDFCIYSLFQTMFFIFYLLWVLYFLFHYFSPAYHLLLHIISIVVSIFLLAIWIMAVALPHKCKIFNLTFLSFICASCSGGMNGYISLCAGDPCPPIFRSPVEGLEDVMDNQVLWVRWYDQC